jgi:hypothetical protein
MPLIVRSPARLLVLVLTACILYGCRSQAPISRQDLVGNYIYRSHDPDGKTSDHEWDHLTLSADGKYDLVEGGPTKAKSEKMGAWSFAGGDRAQVALDHSGYPVQVESGEIRLMIDYDTGIWYTKPK